MAPGVGNKPGPSRVEVDEETEIDVEIVEGEEGKTAGPVPAAMKG